MSSFTEVSYEYICILPHGREGLCFVFEKCETAPLKIDMPNLTF